MKRLIIFLAAAMLVFQACSDDENIILPVNGVLTLSVNGLKDLGSTANYEGWIIVAGAPISTGVFQVDANGNLSRTQFNVTKAALNSASAFVLTIEPNPDQNTSPSETKILAGDFSGNTASLTVGNSMAIGTDFSAASGNYILATPTDGGQTTNELSGVWFLKLPMPPAPGFSLPVLPAGWKYEGWAVINGIPVTTGKFLNTDAMDEAAPFSGSNPGPSFPGEDFLQNAPSGLSFPTNLQSQRIVLTVEPEPDNSTMPFGIAPLVGDVPGNAIDHQNYPMINQSSTNNPAGTASRN